MLAFIVLALVCLFVAVAVSVGAWVIQISRSNANRATEAEAAKQKAQSNLDTAVGMLQALSGDPALSEINPRIVDVIEMINKNAGTEYGVIRNY